MSGRFTTPLAGTWNGSDSPEIVWPLTLQVARARTYPKFAGTLGSTHEPSGFTRTLRFSTLTVQFSLSCCARASPGAHTRSATAAVTIHGTYGALILTMNPVNVEPGVPPRQPVGSRCVRPGSAGWAHRRCA